MILNFVKKDIELNKIQFYCNLRVNIAINAIPIQYNISIVSCVVLGATCNEKMKCNVSNNFSTFS